MFIIFSELKFSCHSGVDIELTNLQCFAKPKIIFSKSWLSACFSVAIHIETLCKIVFLPAGCSAQQIYNHKMSGGESTASFVVSSCAIVRKIDLYCFQALLALAGHDSETPLFCNDSTTFADVEAAARASFPTLKKQPLAFRCAVGQRAMRFNTESTWQGAAFLARHAKLRELPLQIEAVEGPAASFQPSLASAFRSADLGKAKRKASSESDTAAAEKKAKKNSDSSAAAKPASEAAGSDDEGMDEKHKESKAKDGPGEGDGDGDVGDAGDGGDEDKSVADAKAAKSGCAADNGEDTESKQRKAKPKPAKVHSCVKRLLSSLILVSVQWNASIAAKSVVNVEWPSKLSAELKSIADSKQFSLEVCLYHAFAQSCALLVAQDKIAAIDKEFKKYLAANSVLRAKLDHSRKVLDKIFDNGAQYLRHLCLVQCMLCGPKPVFVTLT